MHSHRFVTLAALLMMSTAANAVAEQNPAELKQRIIAQAQTVSANYAFTRTIRSEARWNSKTFNHVTVERFDPSKPAAARWTLVSVNGAPPSRAELRKHRKAAAKRRVVPGYHRLANYFGSPASVSTDADGKTVFQFDTLPKGSVSILERDFSEHASAEASVKQVDGVPLVEQVRITIMPKRTRLLFKIDGYESTSQYRIGPGGKPFLASTTTELSGSGIGMTGTLHSVTTYSDYQAVGNSVAAK